MELKNDIESHEALHKAIYSYYDAQKRPNLPYGDIAISKSNFFGQELEDEYHCDYFIDRKHFIRYSIPIDARNFYAMLSLAIGPNYVSMKWLVSEENQSKFNMNSTTEAVVHNLKMLDEYLAGRLL